MTRTTTVTLSVGPISLPLAEHIQDLQKILAGIPEAYRDSARIETDIEEYEYGDGGFARTVVTYQRPETLQEQDAREKREREAQERTEKRERELFAALSKKFNKEAP